VKTEKNEPNLKQMASKV